MMRAASGRRMLNLGCGHRVHPAWVNADIVPQRRDVLRCDVRQGLPFPDDHFDVVYHSNVIEHIRRVDVHAFLRDCHRVLRPGGILRIATPDTERLCELYLDRVRALAAGRVEAEADHEWLLIEMYDQAVREQSGGAMLDYLRQSPLPNEAFVVERIGEEGREILAAVRAAAGKGPQQSEISASRRVAGRLRRAALRLREALVTAWYGDDALLAMQIGKFRLSGEVHHWLYDRLSLGRLMRLAGFSEPAVRAAGQSAIPEWPAYHLEVTNSGQVIKPDSLFMEAIKQA